MAGIKIDVAAEFVGKKAFKDASKATSNLEKGVARLGKQLAGVFAVTKVVAFGKASLKAFTEDEAAAARLASAVKNLGLAFAQPEIDRYVQKLEASSAIADDMLRPALQSLLTTTGSLAESQKILNLAIDASRGSGKDLTTVTQDLAQAYVGNTRGLRKYNLGLTQAELKTMSFSDVQAKFAKQFSGSNATFLTTYAGKMQVLTVAAGNAQEVIGKGLVDALALAGGKEGDIQGVADSMQSLSTFTADTIRGVGVLAGKLKDLNSKSGGNLGEIVKGLTQFTGLNLLRSLGADSRPRTRANRNVTGRTNVTLFDANAAKNKKLEQEKAKLTAAQVKAQKALTAEQKKQALAKKQSALFDLDQIQLVAALQGNLSKEEELRVKLQLALLTGNTTQAEKLSTQLANSIDSTGKLAAFLQTLPDAKNPFSGWDEWLKNFTKNMAAVTGASIPTTAGAITPPPSTNVPSPSSSNRAFVEGPAAAAAYAASQIGRGMSDSAATARGANIVVQIDGKTIASALQDQSLSGVPANTNRLLGHFSR